MVRSAAAIAVVLFVMVVLPYTYGQGVAHAAAEGHARGPAFDKRYAGAVLGGEANRGGVGDRLVRARRDGSKRHPLKRRIGSSAAPNPWVSSVGWVALWLVPEADGAARVQGGSSDGSGADHLLEPVASSLAVTISSVPSTDSPEPAKPGLPRVRVPVLMYHEIGDGPNELYVSRDNFAAQMALLTGQGYTTITLDQLYAALTAGGPLPARPIVLTFDDGYESAYKVAFPLLREHKFSGVFFIPTRTVGVRNRVTWDQLKEMQAAGMDIESHTVNHSDLEVISGDWTRLIQETMGARDELHAQLGTTVEYFCYPAGRYNAKVLEALTLAGYKGAFTTKPGWTTSAQDPLEWHRVRINRSDNLAVFASKVGIAP